MLLLHLILSGFVTHVNDELSCHVNNSFFTNVL